MPTLLSDYQSNNQIRIEIKEEGPIISALRSVYEFPGDVLGMPPAVAWAFIVVIVGLLVLFFTLNRRGFFEDHPGVRILIGWLLGLLPAAVVLLLVHLDFGIEQFYQEKLALGREGVAELVIDGVFLLAVLIATLIRTYDDSISMPAFLFLTPIIDVLVVAALLIPAAIATAFVKNFETSMIWTLVVVIGLMSLGSGGTIVVIGVISGR